MVVEKQDVQTEFRPPSRYRLARNMEDVTFADNLNRLFQSSGKTQVEVAQDVGIKVSTLNDYLQAKTSPRLNTAIRLAREFGVSVDVLANGSPGSDSSATIGIEDYSQAIGVSYRTTSRLASMSAVAATPSVQGFNTADMLLSDPRYLDVFGSLERALKIAAGLTAKPSADAYQAFKGILGEISYAVAGSGMSKEEFGETFSKKFDEVTTITQDDPDMDKSASDYIRTRGYEFLFHEDAIDHYIRQAADALQSIFRSIAEQLQAQSAQNTSSGKGKK